MTLEQLKWAVKNKEQLAPYEREALVKYLDLMSDKGYQVGDLKDIPERNYK